MASSTGNIKQAYDVNGEKIYPKVILDAIEGEGGKTGMEIIKEAVGGIGMENLKGVSVEYDDGDGNHHLVFKSHYEESAGGYIKETIVGEGPLVIGNYSEENRYADDHIYVSKNLSILGDANTLEFAANADAVDKKDISGKIAHTNNSIQIINNNEEGKLELFGGGEGATECVSISASSMNIPKYVSILKDLNVSGNTTVAATSGATLSVGGDATFSNTITVNKKSRFKDDVSLDGQTASRGSSPKLSFTSYENKTNSNNRATGYIVEHYGNSGNTSLEMYDGTESNAHLSLSGSDKTFTVKVNSNNALILDGSNKVAKIQPYSSDENSPSLVIDGSKKTTTLKSDNNTKLMLDAINKYTVLYGDSYRYMELNGDDGEINLNASNDGNTYFKLYGNSSIDLQADNNRYLYMPSNSTRVLLFADGDENGDAYLELNGNTSQPYTKLSALSDMRLGMNDVSGHLRLQAKGGTYLDFDVRENNNSVRLCADASSYLKIDAISKKVNLKADNTYYLQIDASKGETKLYAGSVTGLHLDNEDGQRDVNLYADNSTYLKLWAGDDEQEVRLYADASSYLQIDAISKEVNLKADNSTYLKLLGVEGEQKVRLYANDKTRLSMDGYIENGSSSYVGLFADNETFIQASTYESSKNKVNKIYLKSGNTSLYLSGGYGTFVQLGYDSTDYIKIDGSINIHRSNTAILTVGDSVVMSSIPMTAKVNDVPDVYVGCPIGTIVMWPAADAPSHWVLCGTEIPVVADKPSGSNYLTVLYMYNNTTYAYYITSDYSKYFKLIKLLNGSDSSTIVYNSWKWGGTQGSPLPIKSLKLVDVAGRFPLAAKDGSINNGYDENGKQLYANTSLGTKGGSSQVKLYAKTMPKHSHNVYSNAATTKGGVSTEFSYLKDSDSYTSTTTTTTGDGKEHSNMPPYLAINFIIKYE